MPSYILRIDDVSCFMWVIVMDYDSNQPYCSMGHFCCFKAHSTPELLQGFIELFPLGTF